MVENSSFGCHEVQEIGKFCSHWLNTPQDRGAGGNSQICVEEGETAIEAPRLCDGPPWRVEPLARDFPPQRLACPIVPLCRHPPSLAYDRRPHVLSPATFVSECLSSVFPLELITSGHAPRVHVSRSFSSPDRSSDILSTILSVNGPSPFYSVLVLDTLFCIIT